MFFKKIYAPTIVSFLLMCVSLPYGLTTFAYAQGVTAELDYTVGADEVLDFVEPDDIFRANVTLHGYEFESAVVVPFDVMLAIDMSQSMEGNDPDNKRLKAAELFLEKCDQNSPTTAGPIRAGIIGFRRQGRVEQGLTDDYSVLGGTISDMYEQDLGVETNIADAMAKAQHELETNGVNNTRAVILLTDGWPTPDSDAQETMIDEELVPEAITKGFRYYTIGLGPSAYLDLAEIAELTGGFHSFAATAGALNSIFTDIFDHVSKTMIANQVTLHVERDTAVASFVPGSLQVPPGIPYPLDGQLDTFGAEAQGWIDVVMGQLGSGDNATLSFELEALECLPVDAPEDEIPITPVRYPHSVVTYLWGTQTFTFPLEEKSIRCKKVPFLGVEKEYYPETSRVEITLVNNYPHRSDIPDAERTFTNIRVFEQLSPYFARFYKGPPRFRFGLPVLDPSFTSPHVFIPGRRGGDILYWKISTLGPEQSRNIRFRVRFLAYAPRDAGKLLSVDWVDPKIIGPPVPEEYIISRVYYDFGNQTQSVGIRNEWLLPAMLPDLTNQGGRPNLYIESSLSDYEFEHLPPEPRDLSTHMGIPWSGPWPLKFNLFERSESVDIFIDSATNGYVNDWSHRGGIDPFLDNDAFDPYSNRLKTVMGQGDLFRISKGNRIYFKVHNLGTADAMAEAKAYILHYAPGGAVPLLPPWEALGDAVAVSSPPEDDYQLLYVEIPPHTIERGRHTSSFGTWLSEEFDTAIIMIQVTPAQNEAHTSNNTATERFLVVP